MRELLGIFLVTQLSYWAGWAARALLYRAPKRHPLAVPSEFPLEFKQWLHDYIQVNRP